LRKRVLVLQRLFSTFANGWPGIGLFLQRLLTAAALFYSAIALWGKDPTFVSIAPQLIAGGAGIFLVLGLWTPVIGTLVAIVELWIAFFGAGDPSIPIILGTLGATLAMIGPGAWSIDAQLFGRKRIETPRH
jgi:putative oxidoreductase